MEYTSFNETTLTEASGNEPSLTQEIGKSLTSPSDRRFDEVRTNRPELDERLFDSRASFKVALSEVSMHLGRDWVHGLFRQIDSLLDLEEWEPDDPVPGRASARTFIRLLLRVHAVRRPGMGASSRGTLIAAWTVGANRLTIDCLPDDKVRWVLTRSANGVLERAAGDCHVSRICAVLEPYDPDIWFRDAQ